MIAVVVTYQCKAGKRDAFLSAIRAEGLDQASRSEQGNLRYAYYLPVEAPDDLLLLESWENAEVLAAHGQMPHYLRLGELKAEYVNETIIEKYEKA